MGATFSRVKTWIAEALSYADLNAEIDNILTNLTPAGVDDYSTNATAMRTDTDPGESGTESLATSLAGEIERLRFAIREIKGTGVSYWYQSASSSISELASALGTSVLANRISSGRVRTGSSQPLFLVPSGAARTVTLQGATTNFVFFYESTQVTISSNITATSLTAAPSTNNTCLINMPAVNDEAWTKLAGEYGTTITVDAMGTEISNLTGKLAGFKLAGSTTEYFIARVDSATQLSNARRGYFFDSADAPIPRATFADNDTITLMKLTWIYAKSDSTLQPGYTNPTVSADEPTSPAIGDYWYDTSASKWKYYSGSWADLDGILVGVCLQDTTNTVAARGFDFFKNYSDLHTGILERASATVVRSKGTENEVSVYGTAIKFTPDRMQWDAATDFDSGVTEGASTVYYLYVKESGDRIISDLAPFDRTHDLKGLYHPFHSWRCLGQVYNNGGSDFVAVIDYADRSADNYKITTQVASNALTAILHANPLSRIRLNALNTTDVAQFVQVPSFISLVIASGSTLGHANATQANLYWYLLANAGTPYLAVSSDLRGSGAGLTSTAVTGNDDSGTTLYAISALTTVPGKLIASMYSTQTTAGTWAAVPTDTALFPPRAPVMKQTVYTSGTGTHTVTLGATSLRFRMVGGGGGAGGCGAGAGGTAPAGSTTSFGSWTAIGGGGGNGNSGSDAGAIGGSGGTGGATTANIRINGGGGGAALGMSTGAAFAIAGKGGGTYFGDGPNATAGITTSTGGTAAAANSGAGGGGAIGSNNSGSSGGGGGEYVEHLITSPAASYAYAVGAGGATGAGAVSGGAGGSGIIIVEEYFT